MIVQTGKFARFIRYVAESTIWILVVLGFFELILQLLHHGPEINYQKDWGVVPVSGSLRVWGSEGYGITHYLAHGEIKTPYDNGSISVVVLGDSQTEALQVSDDAKFVSLAEVNIRSKGRAVNLHNLGLSSTSIPDYIYAAPMIKQYYNPKIIVIQLSRQDFAGENGGDSFNLDHSNYFSIDNVGDLEIHRNDPYASSPYKKSLNKLGIVIYALTKERLFRITEQIKLKFNVGDQLQPSYSADSTILTAARMDDQLTLLKKAYSGTKVVLLLLPLSPHIEKDGINLVDSESIKIMRSAERIGGFYIINPQPEFDRLVTRGYLPRGFMNSLPGEGHLNVFGNRIIGELLAEKILEITQ